MAITATMNASLTTSGAIGGPMTVTVPAVTATSALDIRTTVNLPAGFSPLVSVTGASPILGGGATLIGATGIWLIPGAGTTSSAVAWGVAASSTPVGQFPNPVFISGGLTLANVGVCLSAATTVEIVIF